MLSMNSYSFIIFRPFEMVASKRSSGNALFSITHDLRPNVEDALEINANTCFDSCVTFQRRIMHTTEEADERFYRDTENIAFPALSDEQLATLESLGTRHKVNRGEIVYKAGQRDVPFHLVLSGELEVFESRDGQEQILGTPGPRDFVGDISMLTGTSCYCDRARQSRGIGDRANSSGTLPSCVSGNSKRERNDSERADHATQTSAARSRIYRLAHPCRS